jgi:polyphosphate:AMP phosphotransferase
MFEVAEIGHKLSKDEYALREKELRTSLVDMQYELRKQRFPVILLVTGDDRPSLDDVINRLYEWLDPRFLETNAFGPPTDEERERPLFWRFWRTLPPHGKIGVFAGAWSSQLIGQRLRGEISDADWLKAIAHTRHLEQALIDDGAVFVKFWLHSPKEELKKRLKAAEKEPDKEWRIQSEDWSIYDSYDQGMLVVESYLEQTSSGEAPWHIVESTDARYRDVSIAQTLLAAVQKRLAAVAAEAPQANEPAKITLPPSETSSPSPTARTLLDTIDLSVRLEKEEYEAKLQKSQARLHWLAQKVHQQGKAAVLVFEGWDASGKGGCIRRLGRALNPRMYRIVSIAAPSEDERRYHYLWRFWKHLPRAGRFLIFDRSWYGRVLVERIEGFASEPEWRRAYSEINDFEQQLSEHGIYLAKFWLHMSKDEQLQRFQDREATPYKRFKITPEDYRNRERWAQYEEAATEMIARTSTSYAPWHVIPANDKRWVRVQVLKTVCKGLEKACAIEPSP